MILLFQAAMQATHDPMAGQAEMYRSHPITMIVVSVIGASIVVTLLSILRWLMSRSAWPYHPRGAGGFLVDEIVRWFAVLLPYLALAIIFRFYVYDLHPELNNPNTWAIFIACAVLFRIVLRRLPIIKAMARHIDAAKAQAREARMSGRP